MTTTSTTANARYSSRDLGAVPCVKRESGVQGPASILYRLHQAFLNVLDVSTIGNRPTSLIPGTRQDDNEMEME
jgi:hypothetical protein